MREFQSTIPPLGDGCSMARCSSGDHSYLRIGKSTEPRGHESQHVVPIHRTVKTIQSLKRPRPILIRHLGKAEPDLSIRVGQGLGYRLEEPRFGEALGSNALSKGLRVS